MQLSALVCAARDYQLSSQSASAVAQARDAIDVLLRSAQIFRPGAPRELFEAKLATAQLHADAQLEAVDIPESSLAREMSAATPIGERLRAIASVHSRLVADSAAFSQSPPRVLAAWHVRATAGLSLRDDQRGQPRAPQELPLDPLNTGIHSGGNLADPGEVIRIIIDLLTVNPAGLPPLAQAGLAHLLLVAGAPFIAANGVMGRAAAAAVMIAKGTDPAGRIAVNVALTRMGRPTYVRALQAVAGREDSTKTPSVEIDAWLHWWCEVVTAGTRASAEILDRAIADIEAAN